MRSTQGVWVPKWGERKCGLRKCGGPKCGDSECGGPMPNVGGPYALCPQVRGT